MSYNKYDSLCYQETSTLSTPDHKPLWSPDFRRIQISFINNIERVISLAQFPIYFAASCIVSERFHGRACQQLNIPTDSTKLLSFHEDYDPDLHSKVDALTRKLKLEWAVKNTDAANHLTHEGRMALIRYVDVNIPDESTINSVRSMLSAQLLGIWTAFETLFSDLWETAINLHPSSILDNNKNTQKELLSKLTTDDLKRYNFNLSGKMEIILRGRHNFQKLEEIKEAYKLAFPEKKKINELINDLNIHTLNQARNLIVHRGAIIDHEFKKKALKNSFWRVQDLEIGQPLQLDGIVVKDIFNNTVPLGIDLISEVDGWLKSRSS